MSSRSRMMGAGNASSTIYNTNVNLNTFGGNKKQGITSRVGLDNWANLAVQTYSNGYGRNKLFYMNQLGGVGAGQSMFNGRFSRKDGVHNNIDELINRLEFLLGLYYTNPSDPYRLALVGNQETFRQDLIMTREQGLENEPHDPMIHFDDAYVYPSMRDLELIIGIIAYLNNIIRQDIPYMEYYGIHTLTYVPIKTGKILQKAGYGLTTWHNLRVYAGTNTFVYSLPSEPPFNYYNLTNSTAPLNNGVVPQFYNNLPVSVIETSAFDTTVGAGPLTGTFDVSHVIVIGSSAFKHQTMTTVILPSLTEILAYTFYDCQNLTNINLSNVMEIYTYAFSNCNGLTTINLSNAMVIDTYAFFYCNGLTTVTMTPGSVGGGGIISIASYAFSGCNNLTAIDLSNVYHIGAYAFSGCNLSMVNLSNVTELGAGAFYGCHGLVAYVPSSFSLNPGMYFDSTATVNVA